MATDSRVRSAQSSTAPLLQIRAVHKAFGASKALNGVDLDLAAGEVLALIGENGAGKSTLMKVLSGVHEPDSGSMTLDATAYTAADPLAARAAGVVMIYQELTIAPDLSVAENIVLGREPRRLAWLDRKEMHRLALAALQEMGCEDIDPRQRAGDCSLAQRQMIEIARAMIGEPRVLVLDEPSSSLTQSDVERLFVVIKRLRARGVGIIYISHFLEECRAIADRYLILRDGASVASGPMADADEAQLIGHMVGRSVDELYPRSQRPRGARVLSVLALRGHPLPVTASFDLHGGEVLGIFGLIGSGRSEMLRCIMGLDPISAGAVHCGDKNVLPTTPHASWARGLGMVSENRKEEGLMLGLSLRENLCVSNYAPFQNGPFLSVAKQRQCSEALFERFDLRYRSVDQAIGDLSGGNQQKIAIARLLHHDCPILLLDEPTRGIDVAAKARIYQEIDEQAQAGRGVLMVSSYVPELLGICDRIAVMCRGQLGVFKDVADWDEHSIMAAAIGQGA